MAIEAVDLFCGAGGLTKGLSEAGIIVLAGIDLDPACKYPYTANNNAQFVEQSVTELHRQDIRSFFRKGSLRLLAGCAPCQTFSSYNFKARTAKEKDRKWFLLREFARLVRELTPELVTMENVPGLEGQNVFLDFIQTLEGNGYKVSYQVVNCADYGVPQNRHRLVLLASKLGEIRLLTPEECHSQKRTVRDVIANQPSLNAGEKSPDDTLHRCSMLSPLNLRRIKASKPGGSWRDWPKSLIAECHKRETGDTYSSVYGRMKWDEPAPTITTQFYGYGNGRFGHPEQDRAISLREGAMLQTFPDSYTFVEKGQDISFKAVGRLIGNAVPVRIGELIGRSILASCRDQ